MGSPATAGTNQEVEETRADGIYVTLKVRTTDHLLRRLEERGGDLGHLVLEETSSRWPDGLGRSTAETTASSYPGFGQIRLRVNLRGRGFVAGTFLPLLTG